MNDKEVDEIIKAIRRGEEIYLHDYEYLEMIFKLMERLDKVEKKDKGTVGDRLKDPKNIPKINAIGILFEDHGWGIVEVAKAVNESSKFIKRSLRNEEHSDLYYPIVCDRCGVVDRYINHTNLCPKCRIAIKELTEDEISKGKEDP